MMIPTIQLISLLMTRTRIGKIDSHDQSSAGPSFIVLDRLSGQEIRPEG